MKKSLFFLIIILGIFAGANISRAEQIDNFHADIQINKDGTIRVTEKIDYDFGASQKHGIFRDIPIKYAARGGNYNLRISDIQAKDENNQAYDFATSYPGNNIEIKIGKNDLLVSGKKTYVLSYSISRALNYFASWDELYWNVTGNGWLVGIGEASATIYLPEKIAEQDLQEKCFYGLSGSTSECSTKVSEKAGKTVIDYTYPQALAVRNGLTIVAGFPKGIVQKPSIWQNSWETIKDNGILFLPLLVLVIMFSLWYTRGRDPKGNGTIIAQYEAPDNLTPLEVGTVVDEQADKRDISAEIVYLAVNGYLKIKRIEKKAAFFNSSDYQLIKLKEPKDLTNEFDQDLMKGLFGEAKEVNLSDLDNKFYLTLKQINEDIYKTVVSKGYFLKNPSQVRASYIIVGAVLMILGVTIFSSFGSLWIISLITSGLIVAGFNFFMPRKTAKGVGAHEYILGLKDYLKVAEKDRIDFHNAPEKNPERFEKLLPYAMVLGVEQEWAKQFEGIYNQPPSWYEDPSGANFNSLLLVSSLNNFSSSANANLASAPASASGGGSGFGGGGFSGGGFGGGGGGSW